MRKITSLLMLFCAFVGTAFAEVNSELISKTITVGADATAVTENQWYVLYNHNRQVCVSEETSAFKMRPIPADGTVAELNAGKLFKFVAVDGQDGQYYIVSGNGLYFDFVNNNSSTVSTNPVAYNVAQIGENQGHFYIQHAENGYIADGQNNGESFVCWEKNVPANAGGNNCYHFKPVTLTDVTLYNVTYNYYVGGVLKHTEIIEKQAEGAAVSAPTFGYVTFTAPTGNVSAENNTFDIQCELETAPLAFSTIENPVWQTVEMHRYGSFRIWDYTDDALVSVTEMSADKMGVVDDSKLWCFVGDHFGFKIYNKKAGFNVSLNATNNNPKMGQATDGNDEWIFAKSSASQAENAACFTSRNTTYMNRQASGKIGYYSNNDNGSTCYFTAPEVYFQPAAEEFSELLINYTIPEGTPENAVGIYNFTEEQKNTFVNGVSAQSTNIEVMQELYAMANEIKATATNFKSGYYFVKSTGNGGDANWYLTHKINNGKECVWAQAPSTSLNADYVWKFETCEDGFKIQSANVGKYFQMKTATDGGDNNTYIENDYNAGNKFLLTLNGAGKFIIKNANNENIRTEGDGQVNYWSGEASETWYLIPATELEVEVAAEYGSIHLPFDVTLAEGQKAYAVTATSETSATLTEMEDIPAGEGAILAQGTYTLNIAEATSDWKDNMLEGTNVNTYIAGPAYVLGLVGGEVALAKAKLNKDADGNEGETHFLNNANKAYLPKTVQANVLRFNFGGTTAIESVVNGLDVNAPIYDLSGRRVNAATKGIYIQNGKKFIVK